MTTHDDKRNGRVSIDTHPVGSLAVLSSEVSGASGKPPWPIGTVVRIDRYLNDGDVFVHDSKAESRRASSGALRLLSPEDDTTGFDVVPPQRFVGDDASLFRATLAQRAADMLRSKAPFAGGPSAIEVIILASYLENGISEEMAERIRDLLDRALSGPAVLDDDEEPDPVPVPLRVPLHTNAGALRVGDETGDFRVLKVHDAASITQTDVTVRLFEHDEVTRIAMVKSTPVTVIARVPE